MKGWRILALLRTKDGLQNVEIECDHALGLAEIEEVCPDVQSILCITFTKHQDLQETVSGITDRRH